MKMFFLLPVLLFVGCGSPSGEQVNSSVVKNELKYAKGFSLEHKDGSTFVEVYNPWNNYSLLASYELVSDDEEALENPQKICVPIKRTTCLSSTYLGMISLLDAHETVVSSSNTNWIYDSVLFAMFLEGKIINLGNDLTVGAEAIIASNPDVVLKYIYQSPDPIDPVIKNAGFPLVYIIEFMEEHPLGRAEWIKLVGALLGKRERADSMFSIIEENYLNYTKLASSATDTPKVLCGSIYKGTWYAAGGRSFMARLMQDANSDYYWSADSSSGNLPLSFESVIHKQSNAGFWINANANSLNELVSIEPRNEVFSAFKNGEVYHYNKRVNKNGGLDYYETGVVRPDLLLKDLLVILHPELINSETTYYKKLK